MPPPPAEPFAARIFLGPALRAQPDRRLVKLVREGYETAFEEIVRRYRKPLDRFAAAIVGGHSEDVTQDAFSKALLALRGTTMEIELRPWLYRIVRNTALNDLRDGPPIAEELAETIPGGQSAAVEAERREEIGELMERLRALPEPQRAAIVMRELEGLTHEEIAAALGVSGGAARQAIYRARMTLRDGLGLLIPLPLLRVLFDHGAEAAGVGAGGAATAAGVASAAGGSGATLGGIGAAGALKVGLATALVAGSVGAGVAMQHDRGHDGGPAAAPAARSSAEKNVSASSSPDYPGGPGTAVLVDSSQEGGRGGRGSGGDRGGERGVDVQRGSGAELGGDDLDGPSHGGSGSNPGDSSGHGGRGSGHGGHSGSGDGSGEDRSGERISGGSHSGSHSSGESGGSSGSGGQAGSDGSGDDGGSHGGSGSGGSGSSGSGSGDSGSSDDSTTVTSPPLASEPAPGDPSESPDTSGSGSGGSGSGDSGSGGGEDDS
jgi:RNA polymerase sigma factor (sigma-70 family)